MPVARAVSSATPYAVTLTDDLGDQWLADEPTDVGGTNAGPSPARLLLSSLGACTAITLQMFAARMQWPLTRVEVELQFHPQGKPAASGTDISRKITLQGALSAERRERLLQAANACPTDEVRIATTLQD